MVRCKTALLFILQGGRRIRSASPIKGVSSSRSPALPRCPLSAPIQASKSSSASPKTIFPYPSYQNSPPKSPRRLSFSGIFRSSSSSSPTSIKIFSRTRRGELSSRRCTGCPHCCCCCCCCFYLLLEPVRVHVSMLAWRKYKRQCFSVPLRCQCFLLHNRGKTTQDNVSV